MAIFNSYIKLPEGKIYENPMFQLIPSIFCSSHGPHQTFMDIPPFFVIPKLDKGQTISGNHGFSW